MNKISPTASEQANADCQRREEHGMSPARENTSGAPLFVHSSKIVHVDPFKQPERGDMPTDQHPGASPRQTPNVGGRRSGGAA